MVCPAGKDSQPIERRSGSWLGWLPWSRASGSPKADALGSAERGETLQGAAADASLKGAISSTADNSASAVLAGIPSPPSSYQCSPAHADRMDNTSSGAKPMAALLLAMNTEPPWEDGSKRAGVAARGLGQAQHSSEHVQEHRRSESGAVCCLRCALLKVSKHCIVSDATHNSFQQALSSAHHNSKFLTLQI